MTHTRTLLVAVAHPDDETVSAGATIARYARDGTTRVVIVVLTRGQAATHGIELSGSREALGDLREQELKAAGNILGAHDVRMLRYVDKELGDADIAEIRGDLVAILRETRPDVVLTFDPNGTNAHPDHIAANRFLTDAVSAAADGRWFPHAGPPFGVRRVLWTPPLSVWSMIRAEGSATELRVALARRPGADYVIESGELWKVKYDAMLAHASQRPVVDKHILAFGDAQRVLSVEVFRHGSGERPAGCPAADLFEGL